MKYFVSSLLLCTGFLFSTLVADEKTGGSLWVSANKSTTFDIMEYLNHDVETEGFKLKRVGGAQKGAVTLLKDNLIVYSPKTFEVGSDSFDFTLVKVVNNGGGSVSTSVRTYSFELTLRVENTIWVKPGQSTTFDPYHLDEITYHTPNDGSADIGTYYVVGHALNPEDGSLTVNNNDRSVVTFTPADGVVGNVSLYLSGYRIVNGEYQVFPASITVKVTDDVKPTVISRNSALITVPAHEKRGTNVDFNDLEEVFVHYQNGVTSLDGYKLKSVMPLRAIGLAIINDDYSFSYVPNWGNWYDEDNVACVLVNEEDGSEINVNVFFGKNFISGDPYHVSVSDNYFGLIVPRAPNKKQPVVLDPLYGLDGELLTVEKNAFRFPTTPSPEPALTVLPDGKVLVVRGSFDSFKLPINLRKSNGQWVYRNIQVSFVHFVW